MIVTKTSNTQKKILTIPLKNLKLTDNQQRLDLSNVAIKRTQDISFIDIKNERINEIIRKKLEFAKYAIELNVDVNADANLEFKRALLIFKLFKDQMLFADTVIDSINKNFLVLTHFEKSFSALKKDYEYTINKYEATELNSFWQEFQCIPIQNFAVYRYLQAGYEPYSHDSFVDFIESLEYLYVPDSWGGEIRYKFRLRGTLILHSIESSESKENISKKLREGYDLRSAIVHGRQNRVNNYLKKNKNSWSPIIEPIRAYTCNSIKFFYKAGCIGDNSKRKDLIEKLTIFDR